MAVGQERGDPCCMGSSIINVELHGFETHNKFAVLETDGEEERAVGTRNTHGVLRAADILKVEMHNRSEVLQDLGDLDEEELIPRSGILCIRYCSSPRWPGKRGCSKALMCVYVSARGAGGCFCGWECRRASTFAFCLGECAFGCESK